MAIRPIDTSGDDRPALLPSHLLLHGIVLIFGFTGILGRLITIGSVPLVGYRMAIAVIAIAAYLAMRRVSLALPRRELTWALFTGLVVAAHWVCFFESIKRATVSVALVCLSTGSLFTATLEPVFFQRRLRPYEVLLGLAAALGVGFVFRFEATYTAGILYGLAAALLGAFFTVINGRLVGRHDARILSFYELASGATGVALYLALWVQPGWAAIRLEGLDVLYLFVLGVVCTAFAFIGSMHVMRRLSPFTVILTINLEPIYGILLALLIFGESEVMSLGFYAGAALILISLWLNGIIKRRYGH